MRLVTRGDLDGLTSAVLITSVEAIERIDLVHPQEITNKTFPITPDDILANIPYHPNCGKWFDHHLLTDSNEKPAANFVGLYALAPSAARVIYEYYLPLNPDLRRFEDLVAETDRLDAAQLTREDVLEPRGYILLGFTLDPRTGLGIFKDYFLQLTDWLKTKTIAEILDEPEVSERIDKIRQQDMEFREATMAHSWMVGNVVITDFRDLSPVPVGNRFLVYTLFPKANVSLRIHWGPNRETVAVAVGHSIFNRTSNTIVGDLMSEYGGGGHKGAGTCLLPRVHADAHIAEIVKRLRADG
jgi:hypothetical protein